MRCFETRPEGRFRFAHTGPVHVDVDVAGMQLCPRGEEIGFLIGNIEAELKRNEGALPEAALEEYRKALAIYQEIGKRAR